MGSCARFLLSALTTVARFSGLAALFLGTALSAQTLTEFALPEGTRPVHIVTGADGNVWFTTSTSTDGPLWWYEWNDQTTRIGRMTPAGDVTLFPSRARSFHYPTDIVAGPDGNVWVVHQESGGEGQIMRVTPSGASTEFLLSGAQRITVGPDANLWFTDLFHDIGRLAPTGHITYFAVPRTEKPSDITTGPDGNLWFTYFHLARIGQITPAGVVTEFEVPAIPRRLTSGPDGNLWFTRQGNRIGRMTTSGELTEFEIPAPASNLLAAPDGNIWFTYDRTNRIGRIKTDGRRLADVTIPEPASDMTTGPDGNVWFTQYSTGKIGRVTLVNPPAIDSRILPVVGSAQGVGGSFFRTSVQLHNATGEPIAGRVVFRPSGRSGADSDPVVLYSLQPGQTRSIPDLLPAMGRSGLGSADIEVTSGSVPVMTVRVFNDAGAQGTMGFTEEPMRGDDALSSGESAALLVPSALTNFRFNLGVRTLEAGAAATATVRDASGAVVETVLLEYPAVYHEQQTASAFLGISALPAGGSISISVTAGSAIFYGATVDNTTGDPSLQIARAAD